MIGLIEDKGLLFGLMKLIGEGGSLSCDRSVGTEKSSISLLRTMPVDVESKPLPNCEFTVLVIDTAFRAESTMQK